MKMIFRIFLSLLYASMKAGAIVAIILGVFFLGATEFKGSANYLDLAAPILMGVFGVIVGPFFAFPAIIIAVFLIQFMMKKNFLRKKYFIIAGLLMGALYSLATIMFINIDPLFFVLGGALTGLFVHKDIVSLNLRNIKNESFI